MDWITCFDTLIQQRRGSNDESIAVDLSLGSFSCFVLHILTLRATILFLGTVELHQAGFLEGVHLMIGYGIYDGYYDFFTKGLRHIQEIPPRIREGKKTMIPRQRYMRERTKGIVVRKNRTRYTQPHGRTFFFAFCNFFFLFRKQSVQLHACELDRLVFLLVSFS